MDSELAPENPWAALDPYAQLVTALLPRAAGVAAFDTRGDLGWTSEGQISPDLPPIILKSLERARALTAEAGERILSDDAAPLYLFWLRDDHGLLVSVLAILWRTGEAEPRPFSLVHSLLKPALEVLRRELVSRASIDQLRGVLTARDGDLELLLSAAAAPGQGGLDGTDEIRALLQNATDHLRCHFLALIVPEKSLVVLRTANGAPADTAALARSHRQLISLAQLRREPVMIQSFPVESGGKQSHYRVLSCPVLHPSGRASGVLALFRNADAPEFTQREGRLAVLLARRAAAIIEASYDSVTGLLTRPAFEQRARAALSDPRSERSWCALYIDIDRLHVINDNHGMHVGDKLIAKLGELVRSWLVPGAIAARSSGDRFTLLLPGGSDDAMRFAEALRTGAAALTAASLGAHSSAAVQISVSIGVAPLANPRVEFAHALAVAETTCKVAKDRGRNRVELYLASDASIVRRYADINIASNLRLAMSENRLRLDAQLILPMVTMGNYRPHFELLLRMSDEQGATVGPERFLSAAVGYQLMPAVDRWVIRQALEQLKPQAELLANRPVVFTINLSGQSLGDPGFADDVADLIQSSGLNPALLCFELTESAAIAHRATAEVVMQRLRTLGCQIALDDFGTGLSCLAYLRQLPIDMLKIDGSFVRDILKDPRAEAMVKSIAYLARAMNLVTVAECVETDEIRLRLATLGVDYGQGFAIARPAPLADLLLELPLYTTAQSVTVQAPPELAPVEALVAETLRIAG